MNAPLIHGNRRTITASMLREACADRLSAIRQEDRMTWHDMGHVLGKSEDQAAKYADGSAEMGFVSYAFAKLAWGKRFTSGVDSLLERASPHADPRQAQSCVLRAALALAEALEDGELTVQEVRDNRSTLEAARDAIDAQLQRLKPVDARA
jgi:hypothetical protein